MRESSFCSLTLNLIPHLPGWGEVKVVQRISWAAKMLIVNLIRFAAILGKISSLILYLVQVELTHY